jgi:hypothetical protein
VREQAFAGCGFTNTQWDRLGRIPMRLKRDLSVVMPGLVPGTHVFGAAEQGVGGRDEPGHDELAIQRDRNML